MAVRESLGEFLERPGMRVRILQSLRLADAWQRVAIELSKVRESITSSWLENIEASANSPGARSDLFLKIASDRCPADYLFSNEESSS